MNGINSDVLREFKKILKKVLEMRKKGQVLPATAGEFDPPAVLQDVLKDTVPPLDPIQDIKNVPEQQKPELDNPPQETGGEGEGGGGGEGGEGGGGSCQGEC